jgi:hypothetical protein
MPPAADQPSGANEKAPVFYWGFFIFARPNPSVRDRNRDRSSSVSTPRPLSVSLHQAFDSEMLGRGVLRIDWMLNACSEVTEDILLVLKVSGVVPTLAVF